MNLETYNKACQIMQDKDRCTLAIARLEDAKSFEQYNIINSKSTPDGNLKLACQSVDIDGYFMYDLIDYLLHKHEKRLVVLDQEFINL